jgi:hypothetical protein
VTLFNTARHLAYLSVTVRTVGSGCKRDGTIADIEVERRSEVSRIADRKSGTPEEHPNPFSVHRCSGPSRHLMRIYARHLGCRTARQASIL